jgi:hypothetical protein
MTDSNAGGALLNPGMTAMQSEPASRSAGMPRFDSVIVLKTDAALASRPSVSSAARAVRANAAVQSGT